MILADLFETASLPLYGKQLPGVRGSYGAFIITMAPEDFIRLTVEDDQQYRQILDRPFPYTKDKYTEYMGRETDFGKYQLPFLKVRFPTGQIFGHEGRHRSAMVMKAGGKKIPVVIYPYDEEEYYGQIEYYPDDSDDRAFKKVGPFPDYDQARAATKAERAEMTKDDIYVVRDTVERQRGLTLKGQPDRSDGWDKAAWRVDDFPEQLLGQYNSSVRVTDFRVGLVKGYRHHTR